MKAIMNKYKEKSERFTNELTRLIKENGCTITEFSRLMGVSRWTIYKWKMGHTMSLSNYYKALEVLGITETLEVNKLNK